ncbi:LRR receptor-like serine threonine-protein kinase At4g08850-like [Seminavis robusta]|uniref:LRR receptor-like serine threonine-protein kinase At4g08850-like n=1 Tax=Seminavis robusta TaxID=568900 RepID=A0A9N8DEC2_9STRA|nr:LRR receptor-like serine threonine-protein kinase At4g08850-like [Seminavis robusta]|eukprot:Sro32_g020790.1 LRR receptor-like serine threonine-protein kinase At4g08850-like (765) ;mRNA; r:72322-74706
MNPCQETNEKKSSPAAPGVDRIDCCSLEERNGQDGIAYLKQEVKQATEQDKQGQPSKTESPPLGDDTVVVTKRMYHNSSRIKGDDDDVKRANPKEDQHSDEDMANHPESTAAPPPPGSTPAVTTKTTTTANQLNHGMQSVIFDATDNIQALPSPLTRRAQLPGAFHVGGFYSSSITTSRPPQRETSPETIETATANVAMDRPSNNNDLAVANLVVEEDLHPAIPEDVAAAATRKRQESNKNIKKYGCLGAIFLIIILIIIVVVVVSVRGNKATDSTLMMPSLAPTTYLTQAPTALEGSLLTLLPDETVHAITDDAESPQSKAWQWLLQDYELLPYYSNARVVQRFALATLYYATEGSNWAVQTNWLDHSVHECGWFNRPDYAMMNSLSKLYPGYLSGFFPSTEPPPKPCDDQGLYQHFWLDQNNLAGFLPTEIYLLSTLKTLSLGYNQIRGTISSHIGQLRSLEGLDMSTLQEAGNIPSEIGLSTTLRHIGLIGNNHQGHIPTELWLLTSLEYILIGLSPDLQGSIPVEIGNLSNLAWMNVWGSSLTGTIPTEIGKASSLEWIVLYENRLSGSIPSELMQLPKLRMLSLFENSFQGTVPTELGQISDLALFAVRDCQLTGPVPSELGLLTGLTYTLNLRNNQLSGTIPSELGLLTSSVELDLANNHFNGQIPSEFGQLESMGHLSLAGNDLSGTVPEELSTLHDSLHTLRIEDNLQLSGTIPLGICNLNNSCVSNAIDVCEGPFGLSFNCSGLLCGCDCICDER